MAHYIDKDALLAKIEKMLQNEYACETSQEEMGYHCALHELKYFINNFEVKDVDLEKETKKWWKEHLHLNPKNKLWMDAHQSVVLAKHFFELGLKTQKGE